LSHSRKRRRRKWSVVDEPIVPRQDWVDSLVGHDNDREFHKKEPIDCSVSSTMTMEENDEKNEGLVVMVVFVVPYQEWR